MKTNHLISAVFFVSFGNLFGCDKDIICKPIQVDMTNYFAGQQIIDANGNIGGIVSANTTNGTIIVSENGANTGPLPAGQFAYAVPSYNDVSRSRTFYGNSKLDSRVIDPSNDIGTIGQLFSDGRATVSFDPDKNPNKGKRIWYVSDLGLSISPKACLGNYCVAPNGPYNEIFDNYIAWYNQSGKPVVVQLSH